MRQLNNNVFSLFNVMVNHSRTLFHTLIHKKIVLFVNLRRVKRLDVPFGYGQVQAVYDLLYNFLGLLPELTKVANESLRQLSVLCKVIFSINNLAPVVLKLKVPALEFSVGQVGFLLLSFN